LTTDKISLRIDDRQPEQSPITGRKELLSGKNRRPGVKLIKVSAVPLLAALRWIPLFGGPKEAG